MRWWDFFFYVTFGIVVTSSVRIAGVLLVFSYLIVPAAVGALLQRSVRGPARDRLGRGRAGERGSGSARRSRGICRRARRW